MEWTQALVVPAAFLRTTDSEMRSTDVDFCLTSEATDNLHPTDERSLREARRAVNRFRPNAGFTFSRPREALVRQAGRWVGASTFTKAARPRTAQHSLLRPGSLGWPSKSM